MAIPLYQVDAFTAEPFAGNPAAVCMLDGPADERVKLGGKAVTVLKGKLYA